MIPTGLPPVVARWWHKIGNISQLQVSHAPLASALDVACSALALLEAIATTQSIDTSPHQGRLARAASMAAPVCCVTGDDHPVAREAPSLPATADWPGKVAAPGPREQAPALTCCHRIAGRQPRRMACVRSLDGPRPVRLRRRRPIRRVAAHDDGGAAGPHGRSDGRGHRAQVGSHSA